jgi:hypothetical protein
MISNRKRFLSVTSFVPSGFPGSNTGKGRRLEHRWLARQSSGLPFANGEKTESPPSAVCPTPRAECGADGLLQFPGEVGKRRCEGRLSSTSSDPEPVEGRSSVNSKLLRNGRGTRRLRFSFLADGRHESYQASQRCSQRQPVHAFEQGNSDGTRIVTKIIFCIFPASQLEIK